jgi:hypothetical protein
VYSQLGEDHIRAKQISHGSRLGGPPPHHWARLCPGAPKLSPHEGGGAGTHTGCRVTRIRLQEAVRALDIPKHHGTLADVHNVHVECILSCTLYKDGDPKETHTNSIFYNDCKMHARKPEAGADRFPGGFPIYKNTWSNRSLRCSFTSAQPVVSLSLRNGLLWCLLLSRRAPGATPCPDIKPRWEACCNFHG